MLVRHSSGCNRIKIPINNGQASRQWQPLQRVKAQSTAQASITTTTTTICSNCSVGFIMSMECSRCKLTIDIASGSFFELIHKGNDIKRHFVCCECFGLLHAERGCAPFFLCPELGCDEMIIGHHYHKKKETMKNNKCVLSKTAVKQPAVLIAKATDCNHDPCRFFKLQSDEWQSKHVMVSLQWTQKVKKENSVRTLSVPVPFLDPCESYPKEIKKKLIDVMTILYHVFFFPETTNAHERKALQSIYDLEDYIINNKPFLLQAIIGLTTGLKTNRLLPKGIDSNAYQKSAFIAFWVAVEMMRRGKSNRPGLLQELIGQHLTVHAVHQDVMDILCKFRISTSRNRVRLKDIRNVNQQVLAGWDLSRKQHWVMFVMYDNLGFRKRGARAGYDQYTMVLVNFISPTELKKVGFYLPPESSLPPISRIRLSWSIERFKIPKEAIKPTTEDYTTLGTSIYSHIDALLSVYNDIPNVDEARRLLEQHGNDIFSLSGARISTSYGKIFRARLANEANISEVEIDDEDSSDIEDDDDDDDAEEDGQHFVDSCLRPTTKQKPTMYERKDQQINVDLPIRSDLNKTSTVRGLAEGVLKLRKQVVNSSSSRVNTLESPLMKECGIFCGGDGAPGSTFDDLTAEDPDVYKDIKNFSGGFHQQLNILQKIGIRYADTFLRDFLEPSRDTENKQKWFLDPSDPNQTLAELPEYTDPHYIQAITCLASGNGGGAAISAVDVHDHMIRRAKEFDICMLLLQWLHFVEVANIVRDSEGENDPELYRMGARLALLLFVKTNATKYVRMGLSFWVWWYCASEADKKIHDSFLFTKKTCDGRYIWSDRFVEWFNKDVRQYLGKFARPNQELLVTRTALLIKDRRRWKAGAATTRRENRAAEERTEKTLALSPIFCQQMVLLERWNLWGEGPPRVGTKDHETRVADHFMNPKGTTALNTQILFDISSADHILEEYFEKVYLEADQPTREQRSKSKISLKKTPPTAAEVDVSRQAEIDKQTSTDPDVLEKVTTVAYIKERISTLRQEYNRFTNSCAVPTTGAKKPALARVLAAHHAAVIASIPNFVEMIECDIASRSIPCRGFAKRSEKKKELEHPFYAFTADARNIFSETKHFLSVSINNMTNPVTPRRPPRSDGNGMSTPLLAAAALEKLSLE